MNNPNCSSAMQDAARALMPEYPVLFPICTAWGEMDAFQHINNVVYFRYFESARIAYGQVSGMLDWKESEGIGPIVAASSCRYKRPVVFPDTLIVGVRVDRMELDRMWQHYRIFSSAQNAITTEGECEIVMFNYRSGKKVAIPDVLRARVEALENSIIKPVSPT